MSDDTCTQEASRGEMEIDGAAAPCSYLPQQSARMTYRLAQQLSEQRYEQLLERGWRRFGRVLFRPNCPDCNACTGIRVPISTFYPSKSQRRCLKTFADIADLKLTIRNPSLSPEHIQLYNNYHRDMHHRKQWPFRKITADEYAESFLDGQFPFSREFQYRHNGQLVGLSLVDITANSLSSIYFFHDPEWREVGVGTYSILQEIETGRQLAKDWLYLGYYIRDCSSMNYKNNYRPHQLLTTFPNDDQSSLWHSPTQQSQEPPAAC
jgi:arginyl-tRNA--protein-N-Asp/Glu arginylyltransferase